MGGVVWSSVPRQDVIASNKHASDGETCDSRPQWQNLTPQGRIAPTWKRGVRIRIGASVTLPLATAVAAFNSLKGWRLQSPFFLSLHMFLTPELN